MLSKQALNLESECLLEHLVKFLTIQEVRTQDRQPRSVID